MPDDDRLILPGEGNLAELHKKSAKYDALHERMLENQYRADAAENRLSALLLVFEEMQAALEQVSKTHDLTARALQRVKTALKGGE